MPTDEIQVHVRKFGDRKALQFQWTDPHTGRTRTKSTGTTIRREAERKAVKLEKEIIAGLHAKTVCDWDTFRDRCEDQYLARPSRKTGKPLSHKAAQSIITTLNKATALLYPKPKRPDDVTKAAIEQFGAALLAEGRSPATVKTYVTTLATLLAWGHTMGYVAKPPKIDPMRQTEAKGRPVTGEEFDRMVEKIPETVGAAAAPSWERLLRGLWLSGLRLGEAVALSWDEDAPFRVDLTGRHPLLRILAHAQKSGKDQACPIVPEFAEFLLATPEADRRGRVFRPMRKNGDAGPMREDVASPTICAIGEAAKVIVAKKPGRPKANKKKAAAASAGQASTTSTTPAAPQPQERIKYASAHDLRRSFGARWAKKVMPAVLMELMRHANINTTMKYYATRNAETTAELLWSNHEAASANSCANTQPETTETATPRNDASRC